MLRTQISLTNRERRLLDVESARTGRSIAALIREAVDAIYGVERSAQEDLASMAEAFGAWTDRAGDGAAWVEGVRSGRRLEDSR